MLELLVELLPQAGQFVGVAEFFGFDFLVELAGVGAVDRVVVRVRAFAAGLRAAGTVVTLGDGGFFFGFRAVVVGGFAFHFLGLGTEHGVLFGFGLAFAVLGVVL